MSSALATPDPYSSVNRAFSKQSAHFDQEDYDNPILQYMRAQVRTHVEQYLKPDDVMLELNAGTGLDAAYFSTKCKHVHATDLSDGMISKIHQRIGESQSTNLSVQQLSYDQLNKLDGRKFDYVFSNFGGLNCIEDLTQVTKHLPGLLNPGARITWVIMPPLCPWDWLAVFKGNFANAFKRLKRNGTVAHLEGEYFKTYYHSRSAVTKALGNSFEVITSEGLGVFIPPPDKKYIPANYPKLFHALKKCDETLRFSYPFNRWADHIIITLQVKETKQGKEIYYL